MSRTPKYSEDLFEIDNTLVIEENFKPPVDLKNKKIREVKRYLKDITLDLLHSENENGDSRAEVMLDKLLEKAENGDYKSAELVLKIIRELDDNPKVDVKIPDIKIIVDPDVSGIRYREK